MGYRSEWLGHAGAVARHVEVALHAIDRETPEGDLRVLIAGAENGGAIEVWQKIGAEVLGLDKDPACADLGLPVQICDVNDESSVRGALHGRIFDVIIDSTREGSPWMWPFLRSGGRIIFEDLPHVKTLELASCVSLDKETWLPVEEIMRISIFPRVTVVEKRNPRVLPYLDIIAGNFADVTGEQALLAKGARWVVA